MLILILMLQILMLILFLYYYTITEYNLRVFEEETSCPRLRASFRILAAKIYQIARAGDLCNTQHIIA